MGRDVQVQVVLSRGSAFCSTREARGADRIRNNRDFRARGAGGRASLIIDTHFLFFLESTVHHLPDYSVHRSTEPEPRERRPRPTQ